MEPLLAWSVWFHPTGICSNGRGNGEVSNGSRSVQLQCTRYGEYGAAVHLWLGRTEGQVVEAVAGWKHSLLLQHVWLGNVGHAMHGQ